MANASIGALFMAGILPGIVMTSLMMLTVWLFARRHGWGSDTPFDLRELARAGIEVLVVAPDRFRSLPISRSSVLIGRSVASLMHSSLGVVVMALTVGAVVYLKNSPFGLALQAVREDAVSASMAGVNIIKMRVIAWLASALVAGLAGGALVVRRRIVTSR